MTKITLEDQYGKYTVEVKQDDMPLDDLIEHLVRPLLIVTGYNEETIKKHL